MVSDFLYLTFRSIQEGDLTELIASFCYGREDIIPDMFRRLITNLSDENPIRWEKLEFYFTEHIDCDESRHGPMARAMLERHCSNDLELWRKPKKCKLSFNSTKKLLGWDFSQNRGLDYFKSGIISSTPFSENPFHNSLHPPPFCSRSKYPNRWYVDQTLETRSLPRISSIRFNSF